MVSKKKCVIFGGSFVNDPSILNGLNARYEDWLFCPLRMQAWEEARQLLPARKIIMLTDFISEAERQHFMEQASELKNEMYVSLQHGCCPDGTLAVADGLINKRFFAFFFIRHVIHNLRLKYPDYNIDYHETWGHSFLDPVTKTWLAITQYCVCQDSLKCTGMRAVLKQVAISLGRLVNKAPEWLTSVMPKTSYTVPNKPCKYWYAGLHSGDVCLRVQWLSCLKKYFGEDLGILHGENELLAVSADEAGNGKDFEYLINDEQTMSVEAFGRCRWRVRWMGCLSSLAIRNDIARVLSEHADINKQDAWKLASFMVPSNANHVCAYRETARLMDQLKPEVIIASSLIGHGFHVREWARKNNVKYVKYPHGIFVNLNSAVLWDADETVTYGSHEYLFGVNSPFCKNSRVHAGGTYLQAQLSQFARRWERYPPEKQRKVTYIASKESDFRPDLFNELVDGFYKIACELMQIKCQLRLRLHPRYRALEPMADMIESIRRSNMPLSVSDGACSLFDELQESCCALVRQWSGAVLQAIYYGIPTIVWMPRNTLYSSEYCLLNSLPLVARDERDLVSFVLQLREERFMADVLNKQQVFVNRYLKNSDGKPEKNILEVAMKVIGEVF